MKVELNIQATITDLRTSEAALLKGDSTAAALYARYALERIWQHMDQDARITAVRAIRR